MHLLLVFAAIVCAHWTYAAVVPIASVDPVAIAVPISKLKIFYDSIFFSTKNLGECPVYKIRCLIKCPLISASNPCANGPKNCCTSDCQCKGNKKCCQPACGCYKQCTNVTSVIPIPMAPVLNE
jgi:hypothetical protein